MQFEGIAAPKEYYEIVMLGTTTCLKERGSRFQKLSVKRHEPLTRCAGAVLLILRLSIRSLRKPNEVTRLSAKPVRPFQVDGPNADEVKLSVILVRPLPHVAPIALASLKVRVVQT